MYHILVALRGALAVYDDTDCDLIISIIIAIGNAFRGLSVKSKYLRPLFWVAHSLLQIGHVQIFLYALNLMQVVLKRLAKLGLFDDGPTVGSILFGFREPIAPLLADIDSAVGIHFVCCVS